MISEMPVHISKTYQELDKLNNILYQHKDTCLTFKQFSYIFDVSDILMEGLKIEAGNALAHKTLFNTYYHYTNVYAACVETRERATELDEKF